MYKRVCNHCGVPNLLFAEGKKEEPIICHHCGVVLGPDLNQQIGEAPLPQAAKTQHFPQVNDVLSTGHIVLAVYKNQIILAHLDSIPSPTPFVVWNLDQDGDPYGGSYFSNTESAEREFVERCFPWAIEIDDTEDPIPCISGMDQSTTTIKSPVEDRALNQLVRIKRDGICIDGHNYWNEILALHIGQTVQAVVSDYKVEVHGTDGSFLCSFEY